MARGQVSSEDTPSGDVQWPDTGQDWEVVDSQGSAPRRRLQQGTATACEATVEGSGGEPDLLTGGTDSVEGPSEEEGPPAGVGLMQVVCPEGYGEGTMAVMLLAFTGLLQEHPYKHRPLMVRLCGRRYPRGSILVMPS